MWFTKLFLVIVLIFSQSFGQDIKARIDSINNLPASEYLSNLYKSKNIFEENLNRARQIGYKKGEAKALHILAIIYYLLNNYEKSTTYNIESLKIFEQEKDYESLANAYGEFGYQMKRRELDNANEYMLKGIKIAEKYKLSKPTLAKLYDNYGVLKEMEGKLDSALLLYKRALRLKTEINDTIGIPYSLNKIANVKALQGKFSEAYYYLSLSDNYREKETHDYGRADNLAYHGDFLTMEGKIDSAIYYYKKSLDISLKNGYTFLVQFIYQQLSNLYSQKKDFYNSLEYYKKYIAYKDSLINIATNEKIAELEIAFETSEKDKLIAQKELQLRQRAILFITIGTTLLFLVLTMTGLYAYQVQKRKAIAAEAELTKRIAVEVSNRKIFEEKLRIARELHDNIGSQLTFIISSLDNIKYQSNEKGILNKIEDTSDFARLTLNELRTTIWAMKFEKGELSTLITKIRDYLNRIKSSTERIKINIQNNTSKEYELKSIQMLNLFRAFQECIQNVIKHSKANECNIIFSDIENGFSMQICDNGVGIDLSNSLESTGLSSLKIRAEEANGKFYYTKNNELDVNCGTRFIFEIICEPEQN
ncbi:MAG: histidine kinase [Ignavibacteria bacterium]|nr:histidine kinase [Ignavibacteria bacterium]